jgi:hypothetical protein
LSELPDTTPGPTVCELLSEEEDALTTDLRTGENVLVDDAGLAREHPPGRCFYGRLVQVDGDERFWFALLPTIVDDPETILAVLEAAERGAPVEERLAAAYRPLGTSGAR